MLLVDDDDSFTLLFERAMRKAGIGASLQYVTGGEKAMEYLSAQNGFNDRDRFPFPSLVLLDLKMPGVTGFDVLEWKKEQPELKSLRVVMWSSSELPEDIQKAYDLGAVSYLVKPIDQDGLVEIAKGLEQFLTQPSG